MSGQPTKALAQFAAALRYEDLPQTTLETIQRCLIDGFACAVAGLGLPVSTLMADYAREQQTVEEALLWQHPASSSLPLAAMANATLIHALLFDDTHPTKTHPGCVIIPAALAAAEHLDAGGEQFVTAIAAGYEVMVRVAYGVDPSGARIRGWQLTPIVGPFGAAAAVGNLMGFSAAQMASALGLAGTQSGGLYAFTADGSDSEKFHPASATRNGIIAAQLAVRGLQGPTLILEAEDGGFCATFSDRPNLERITEGLGDRFDLETMLFKPYPSCASLVAAVECATRLHKQHRELGPRIGKVRAHVANIVDRQCGAPGIPQGPLQGQLNLRHCVAVALQTGDLQVVDFSAERMRSPQVRDLADRIEIVISREFDAVYPERFGTRLEVELLDGGTVEEVVPDAPGSNQNPLDSAALLEKYHKLVSGRLPVRTAEQLAVAAQSPQGIDDIRTISLLIQEGVTERE